MNNDEISQQVRNYELNNYLIDVAKAMANLTQVGQLLKRAYAGTKKMASAEFTMKMLSHCQRFIKDSMVTTNALAEGSVRVLKCHKLALTLTEKEKYATALQFLAKATTIPAEMLQISRDRLRQAEDLSNLAEKAILAASRDQDMEVQRRETIRPSIAETVPQLQAELHHASAVDRLRDLQTTSSQIDRAVAALSIAINTLVVLRTTFEEVRIFWQHVEKHTKRLERVTKDAPLLAEDDAKEELIGTIYDSAICWLAFGLTSQTALEAIKPADQQIDAVMNNLPNDAEDLLLLTEVEVAHVSADHRPSVLLQRIEQDDNELEAIFAQSEVANG